MGVHVTDSKHILQEGNMKYRLFLGAALSSLLFISALSAQPIFVEKNGLVVVEVESVSPGTGWVSETSQTGFAGASYYKWNGGDNFSSPGSKILEYKIRIASAGEYRFQWHNKVGKGNSSTDFNDTWLKIPDATDFYAKKGTNVVHPHGACKNDCPEGAGSGGWFKIYSSGTTSWTWSTNTSDNNAHSIYAKFSSPGVYTVQISGRSNYHCVDRFVLYKEGTVQNATNLTNPESARDGTPAPSSVIMKAIEFTNKSAGQVPFYVDGQRLAIDAAKTSYRDKWAAATSPFKGATGTYNIVFSAMYEGDGDSKYALKIGTDSVGNFQCASAWTGKSQTIPDYTIYDHTFRGVTVTQGTSVKVYAMCNSNGKVPEGASFAWSRGRWAQLSFVPATSTKTLRESKTDRTRRIRSMVPGSGAYSEMFDLFGRRTSISALGRENIAGSGVLVIRNSHEMTQVLRIGK